MKKSYNSLFNSILFEKFNNKLFLKGKKEKYLKYIFFCWKSLKKSNVLVFSPGPGGPKKNTHTTKKNKKKKKKKKNKKKKIHMIKKINLKKLQENR